jgi:dihydrodipicolinate synthase/N-acetylneuraminate lyase
VKNVELPKPLRGIIPPMVTPLTERDRLDVAGLERLVEHILDGGVHGLFVLGTTGEAPSLSYRLRTELIDRVEHVVLAHQRRDQIARQRALGRHQQRLGEANVEQLVQERAEA